MAATLARAGPSRVAARDTSWFDSAYAGHACPGRIRSTSAMVSRKAVADQGYRHSGNQNARCNSSLSP